MKRLICILLLACCAAPLAAQDILLRNARVHTQGSAGEALRRYSAALEIFKSENENPEIGNTFVEIARIYKKQNNYDAASRFLRKAEDTFEKFNLSYGIISVMKEYSEILIAQKDFQNALECCQIVQLTSFWYH